MELVIRRAALALSAFLLVSLATTTRAGIEMTPAPVARASEWLTPETFGAQLRSNAVLAAARLSGGAKAVIEHGISAASSGSEAPGLLQFRSGGHVLGFTGEGMMVVGGDHLLKVGFVNAAAVAPEVPATASIGSDMTSREKGAAPFTELHYRNLWPGIDLRYDAHSGIARSTYTLAPGADPARIRLSYNVPVEVTEQGALTMRFANGMLTESPPIAWQEIDGNKAPVAVAFQLHPNNELGFVLHDYDTKYPLVIDPTISWNTFLGRIGYGITTDSLGSVYVTGLSTNNIAEWNGFGIAPKRAMSANGDAFVAKLDAATGALVWYTFLGGGGTDYPSGIATDSNGNVLVTGYSGATWGTPVRAYSSGNDAFVAKLDATTGILGWNTFLGSSGDDRGNAITAGDDGSGTVYAFVTGFSTVTWGTPIRQFYVGYDAFVAKLNIANGALSWNTFLGYGGTDVGRGIASDSAGSIYVTGSSSTGWASSPPVRLYTSGDDAFVAKLDGAAGALVWHTFLGGGGNDYGRGVSSAGADHVFVTGSSNFSWGVPERGYVPSGNDAFVAALDRTTGELIWNTFLGSGSGHTDDGNGIAADGAGNVYVTGTSDGSWGVPVGAYAGERDAFVAQLDGSNGKLMWNTFLGGTDDDYGYGIAIDAAGDIYATGVSYVSWGNPVHAHSTTIYGTTAYANAFAAKISWRVLTVNGTGEGTGFVTTTGISCALSAGVATGDCLDPYNFGSTISLTPVVAAGSYFDGWSGDPDCVDGTVTMDSAKTCTATFRLAAAPPVPAPIASISDLDLDFGSVVVGTTAGPLTTTLTNTGTEALNVSGITTAAPYSLTHTCPGSLAAGDSCLIHVGFAPDVLGTAYGNVSITTNATGSPHSVALSGTGVEPPPPPPEPPAPPSPEPTPSISVLVNNSIGGYLASFGNPVKVTYTVAGCAGKEMFLVLRIAGWGGNWWYVNTQSKLVALPAILAQIEPYMTSGPYDGTHTLFEGNVPPGDFEIFLGCDNVKDGHLNIDTLKHIDGVYGYAFGTVQ